MGVLYLPFLSTPHPFFKYEICAIPFLRKCTNLQLTNRN